MLCRRRIRDVDGYGPSRRELWEERGRVLTITLRGLLGSLRKGVIIIILWGPLGGPYSRVCVATLDGPLGALRGGACMRILRGPVGGPICELV